MKLLSQPAVFYSYGDFILDTDFFAGYRGCKCLEGSYRTHMFEKCHKCAAGLVRIQDDSNHF